MANELTTKKQAFVSVVDRHELGRKLGYVPEKDKIIFARLMDAGFCLRLQGGIMALCFYC